MRKAPDGGKTPFGAEAYFDKEAKGMEEQDKKIVTNGDRIRAMDDAALAERLRLLGADTGSGGAAE